MIVRIFLPEALYSLKSVYLSKFYWIFGQIECNDDGNVSIFIVNTKETGGILNCSQQQQAIGCISPGNETHAKQLRDGDFIVFSSNSTNGNSNSGEKSTLQLKILQLPNFIPAGQSFQIQIFLYHSQTFADLAQRIDEPAWSQRPDAIAKLLVLIKRYQEQKSMSGKIGPTDGSSSDSQKTPSFPPTNPNQLIPLLLTISLIIHSKLKFLNSSFIRHFHFWTANLQKLTQNR